MEKTRMKIGLILIKYPKLSEPFIGNFISHISSKHELILLADYNAKVKADKNISIIPYLKFSWSNIGKKLLILLKAFFFFPRFLKLYQLGVGMKQLIHDAGLLTTANIDCLHFPFGNLAFGREHYAAVLNAKMTISFRGSDINVFPIFHELSYKDILRASDKIHCNSIELQNKLASHGFHDFQKVQTIHSAIRNDYLLDLDILEKLVNKREYKREIFLTVGRLHWVKDYELTLKSLALLLHEGYDFEYRIVGSGPQLEKLMFLIDFYGLKNHVLLLGAKDSVGIKSEMQKATLYIQTSYAEGFSNSCLEAQSQGLMCVVTNVSGMSACIEQNKTGYIVEDRNPESIKNALVEIMKMPVELRNDHSIYAGKRVMEKFSSDIQKKQWLSFFNF